jgi:hypothetical protein
MMWRVATITQRERDTNGDDGNSVVAGYQVDPVSGEVPRPEDVESRTGRYISSLEIRLGIPGPRDLADFEDLLVAGRHAPKATKMLDRLISVAILLSLSSGIVMVEIAADVTLAGVPEWRCRVRQGGRMLVSLGIWLYLIGLFVVDGAQRKARCRCTIFVLRCFAPERVVTAPFHFT